MGSPLSPFWLALSFLTSLLQSAGEIGGSLIRFNSFSTNLLWEAEFPLLGNVSTSPTCLPWFLISTSLFCSAIWCFDPAFRMLSPTLITCCPTLIICRTEFLNSSSLCFKSASSSSTAILSARSKHQIAEQNKDVEIRNQ